jgi:hypothetical protein
MGNHRTRPLVQWRRRNESAFHKLEEGRLASSFAAPIGNCFWPSRGDRGATTAGPLSLVNFSALATRCTPSVSQETLGAVVRTESNFNPWTLHDNTSGVTERPSSLQATLSDAWRWIGRGDSVDISLMQINSANFGAFGITARAALDPRVLLAPGAAVLRAANGGGQTGADEQVTLLMALSRYNTGSPFRGIMNGYAQKITANLILASSMAGGAAVLPEDYSGGTTRTNWQVASVWLYSPTILVHVCRFLLNGQARTVTENLGSRPVSTFSSNSIATPISWWPA